MGCRVAQLAFRTADRLWRAIPLHSLIAGRLIAMTQLGRPGPACAAELRFTAPEPGF